MTVALKDVYVLVEGVLDEGLSFVANYLEKILDKPILITENSGKIHYPATKKDTGELDDAFINIPSFSTEYFYNKNECTLYYRVDCNYECAYIIIKNIPTKLIKYNLSILNESKLAVKCYFSKINKDMKQTEKELTDYLLKKSNKNIRDIIMLSEIDVETNYRVLLIEINKNYELVKFEYLRAYIKEFFRRNGLEIIIASWDNKLVIIVPSFQKDLVEINTTYSIINCNKLKLLIENKFNINISIGAGQSHKIFEINKSYYEACVAITLPKLLGKKNYVQNFNELGIYYPIFSLKLNEVKSYCLNVIGKIIEHDQKADGELLLTLRKLFDTNFNTKLTAETLFIHVNTLYYRINKIEQILDADLSKMETRVELFTAIKVWDTLNINKF